jgi:hypothetical protein
MVGRRHHHRRRRRRCRCIHVIAVYYGCWKEVVGQ